MKPASGVPIDDIIGWDVTNWSRCLSFWEPWIERLDRTSSRVLVLGDPKGGLSLWLALLGFNVLCTDYTMPEEAARSVHERWSVADRVSYAAVDAFDIRHPSDSFDVVACKSVLGGLRFDHGRGQTRSLEGQQLAVEEIRRVLKPGGVFLGAENLAGTRAHAVARSKRPAGRAGWYYLRTAEIQELCQRFASCEQRAWGFLGTHWPGTTGINHVTAMVDAGLSRWLPQDWLYISFFRARK